MRKNLINNYYFRLLLLSFIVFIIDFFWLDNINPTPAWDQGYHLSNTFKMHNIYNFYANSYETIWNNLLKVTDSYRGPLTYFLSSIFLKIFGISYKNAYLSNHIFNILCIFSIFELGKTLFCRSVGFWAAIIFTFSPLIISQRNDYLIDLSLTSFSILTFLLLTKWFLSTRRFSIFSILSGISFGFIFLVKPTGISLLIFPLIITICRRIYQSRNKRYSILEILIFCFFIVLIIYPWFSRNWITIISSIVNAWQWGIKYQEGFEISEFETWTYYISKIPNILGELNFLIILIILIYKVLLNKKDYEFPIKNYNFLNIFYFSFFFNVFLITLFMSTKEVRFFLPIWPIICIYLSRLFHSNNKIRELFFKKIILISLIVTSITSQYKLVNYFVNNQNPVITKASNWYRKEIINEIKKNNENLISVLAVLPDTREINTFNLEAEASKEGEYIAVRQIISNRETYKFDLENFDWFLIKTGNQGVMKNEARNLIEEQLINNDTFITHKEWQLPDKSYIKLIRRKYPTVNIKTTICNGNIPVVDIKKINNGLKLIVEGNGKTLESSKILLDIKHNQKFSKDNISIANGMFHPKFNKNSCYLVEQNTPLELNSEFKPNDELEVSYIFLNKSGKKIDSNKILLNKNILNSNTSLMTNKIKTVEELGLYLKVGEFDKLFKMVGIINQSDPKQIYLNNAEDIYWIRYGNDKNEKNLYSILISQILQREIKDAKRTTDIIISSNKENPNQHIFVTKALIDLYLLNINDARISINKAKSIGNFVDNDELINTIDKIINFFEYKFF